MNSVAWTKSYSNTHLAESLKLSLHIENTYLTNSQVAIQEDAGKTEPVILFFWW